MLLGLAFGLMLGMALLFVRLARGPTIYDRALAANSLSTKVVLLIAVISFFQKRPQWLDVALVYALIGFVGVIAVVKFLRYRALHAPMTRPPGAAHVEIADLEAGQ